VERSIYCLIPYRQGSQHHTTTVESSSRTFSLQKFQTVMEKIQHEIDILAAKFLCVCVCERERERERERETFHCLFVIAQHLPRSSSSQVRFNILKEKNNNEVYNLYNKISKNFHTS